MHVELEHVLCHAIMALNVHCLWAQTTTTVVSNSLGLW